MNVHVTISLLSKVIESTVSVSSFELIQDVLFKYHPSGLISEMSYLPGTNHPLSFCSPSFNSKFVVLQLGLNSNDWTDPSGKVCFCRQRKPNLADIDL